MNNQVLEQRMNSVLLNIFLVLIFPILSVFLALL